MSRSRHDHFPRLSRFETETRHWHSETATRPRHSKTCLETCLETETRLETSSSATYGTQFSLIYDILQSRSVGKALEAIRCYDRIADPEIALSALD